MSNQLSPSKHNIWVNSIPSLEQDRELFTVEAEVYDHFGNFQSGFGKGLLKIYETKIVYSIKGENIAFIHLSDEVQYNSYQDISTNSQYIKITKKQKCTFILLSQDDIAAVDQQLNKIIFKNDFYSSYDVIDLIGNGTYTQVSLVKHKISGKKFAVKTISKIRVNSSTQNKKELFNEINLLRRLNHKNIVKGIEYFETDNAYKIVFEYYNGKTLENRLQKIKSIKLADACFIMKQILQGLEYLHSQNIMHRDLKPENILLKDSTTYEIVIADIGFAQDLYQDFVLPKCGSPGYIAPEVMNSKDGKDCGVKTDMFSCGLLFYRLVAGKPLFGGKTVESILMENKKFKIDLSSSQIAEYPHSIQKIIQRMLEINPVKRISAEQALLSGFYQLENEDQQYICNNQVNDLSYKKGFKSSFNSDKGVTSNLTASPLLLANSRGSFANTSRQSLRTESSDIRIGKAYKEKIEEKLSFEKDFRSPSRISKISTATFRANSPVLKITSSFLQKSSPLKKICCKGSAAQTLRDSIDNIKNPSQFTQKRSFISELR